MAALLHTGWKIPASTARSAGRTPTSSTAAPDSTSSTATAATINCSAPTARCSKISMVDAPARPTAGKPTRDRPTVTKSGWIDAGPGDDRVEIRSGRPILADATERAPRNDDPATAFDLGSVNRDQTFQNLTLDSPTDEDWYLITFDVAPQAGD